MLPPTPPRYQRVRDKTEEELSADTPRISAHVNGVVIDTTAYGLVIHHLPMLLVGLVRTPRKMYTF